VVCWANRKVGAAAIGIPTFWGVGQHYAAVVATGQTAARRAVAECCASPLDDRAFRAAALEAFRPVLPFDGYVWVLTDPSTSVGVSPLAYLPDLDMRQLPDIIRAKYATTVNRWTTMPTGCCAGLAAATDGELDRSALWREGVKVLPVVDILSGVLRDRYGCWGFIDLWRGHGPVFSDDDAMFLGSLLDQLTAAQRSRVAGMFGFATSAADDRGPALVLLDDNLRPVTETPAAEQSLRRLLPTDPRDAPIPAAALNVAAQLLASERGIDTSPARSRMHSHGGAWVTLQAARLRPSGATLAASMAVTIDSIGLADRVDVFGRAHAFTNRETDVVVELSRGNSTRQAAHRLGLSEYTVQDHLKAIFAKSSTSSRAELIARASGSAES
jgi:DNA-binding NarL/FixJ family response regulator